LVPVSGTSFLILIARVPKTGTKMVPKMGTQNWVKNLVQEATRGRAFWSCPVDCNASAVARNLVLVSAAGPAALNVHAHADDDGCQ
jgi:hypothetical protein